jgi:hypothetical protein
MMRKTVHSPEVLQHMPSLLGSYFRIAMYGRDDFDYSTLLTGSDETKLNAWQNCRVAMGMHSHPDPNDSTRQQYVDHI